MGVEKAGEQLSGSGSTELAEAFVPCLHQHVIPFSRLRINYRDEELGRGGLRKMLIKTNQGRSILSVSAQAAGPA
jgi:hypothetical protein